MTPRRLFVLPLVLLATTALPCRADLVLDIPDGTVTVGGLLTLTVTASGPDASDAFDSFSVAYVIAHPTAVTPQFVAPTGPTTDPTLTSSHYVFAGNSADHDSGSPSTFGSTNGSAPFDHFFGGDGTLNPPYDVTPGANRNVITVLSIRAPSFVVSPGGDQYQISLSTDPNFTGFTNSGGNTVAIDTLDSKLFATITVRPATAAPEPGALLLGLVGASFLGFVARRRRKPSRLAA